jgi:acyl-CoA oxidase
MGIMKLSAKTKMMFVRFGTFLGLAHAAMTAEGDNSVLMQKVAKERLGVLAKQPLVVKKPANRSLDSMDYLLYLVRARELNLFNELGNNKTRFK